MSLAMKSSIYFAALCCVLCTYDTESEVQRIVASLSLEQKVRQLDTMSASYILSNGAWNQTLLDQYNISTRGIGIAHDFYPPTGEWFNKLQSIAMSNNAGVPMMLFEECLHGYNGNIRTVFPIPLALSASFNPALALRVGAHIALEARSVGVHICLTPVLGTSKDPRWGRVEETFGEDVFHNSEMARAIVKGLQNNNNLTSTESVVSLTKHFAGYSTTESGLNTAPNDIGRRDLYTNYLPTFAAAIEEGSLGTMCCYSEVDGVPPCGDDTLLTDFLRTASGFEGVVVSDLGAVSELNNTHRVANGAPDGIRQYLEAGGNAIFYDYSIAYYEQAILDLISSGQLSETVVDERVADVIRVKHRLGLFENPYVDPNYDAPGNRQLAFDVALESAVLLSNSKGVLPLSNASKVLVVGINADEVRMGDYHQAPIVEDTATLVDGLLAIRSSTLLKYEVGCSVTDTTMLFRPRHFPQGIASQYYRTTDFHGPPDAEFIEMDINFAWYQWGIYNVHRRAPAGFPASNWSALYTGILLPDISVDGWLEVVTKDVDTFELLVSGKVVMNNTTPAVKYVFDGSPIPFTLRYVCKGGDTLQMRWKAFPDSPVENERRLQTAVSWADSIVVVLGENENTVGEDFDSATLNLFGNQSAVLGYIRSISGGKPLVLVLDTGRPLAVASEIAMVDAAFQVFFSGEQGGAALAWLLFGFASPSGKLPITIPRHVGQLPVNYNHKPSKLIGRYNYIDMSTLPLFSFGHGLSYTTFEYISIQASQQVVPQTQSFNVSVTVKNNGNTAGAEVVQLYIRDEIASVTTPIIQLKGSAKLSLLPQQTSTAIFTILPSRDLTLINRKWETVCEPGNFTLYASTSSNVTNSLTTTITVV